MDTDTLEISRLALLAPRNSMAAIETFYGSLLGLVQFPGDGALSFAVGAARLEFSATTGEERPFYHFALLARGNRFAPAHEWLADRVELLPHPDTGNTTFDFDFWNAQACYFHDPAGSIVEFIAHRGHAESSDTTAPFAADELVGISEIGVVTADPPATADALHRVLGLQVWSGGLDGATSLAFIGRKAHTLIVCRPDRGWLPTGRPAEIHPAEITLTGAPDARRSAADLRPMPYLVNARSAP